MTSLSSLDAARIAVAGLTADGVRLVVLCPGSRSAPLAYALAEAEARGEVEIAVRIDERSAGFTAVGAALASGRPTAVVTTSGTAVGNLMPAVMESDHAGVPLVVVSADRPAELHGSGANQTTEQVDLFGEHVRFAASVAAGESPETAVRTALSAASGLLEGVPPGPVQLNLCFREPLVPGGEWSPESRGTRGGAASGSGPRALWASEPGFGPVPGSPGLPVLPGPGTAAGLVARRTVVLAGHDAGPLAQAFAAAHGLPLLAEPSSNARFGGHAVGPYRLLLDAGIGRGIERVVLFGRPTLSRPVTSLLARGGIETALYHPAPAPWFVEGRRRERLIASLDELSSFAGRGASGWLDRWLLAGSAAQSAVDAELAAAGGLTGPRLAQLVWAGVRGQLLLGSSNGIRDVDLAAAPAVEPVAQVFANRGLAGIDGTLSTAAGLAWGGRSFGGGARGRGAVHETTAFLGDLTFLHDAGGLFLGAGEEEPRLRIVVLNDGGGAIFGLLEHGGIGGSTAEGKGSIGDVNGAARQSARDAVERLFATPHTVDLAALAAAYGVRHRLVRDEADAAVFAEPWEGREIVEARVPRAGLRALHAAIKARVAAVVEGL